MKNRQEKTPWPRSWVSTDITAVISDKGLPEIAELFDELARAQTVFSSASSLGRHLRTHGIYTPEERIAFYRIYEPPQDFLPRYIQIALEYSEVQKPIKKETPSEIDRCECSGKTKLMRFTHYINEGIRELLQCERCGKEKWVPGWAFWNFGGDEPLVWPHWVHLHWSSSQRNNIFSWHPPHLRLRIIPFHPQFSHLALYSKTVRESILFNLIFALQAGHCIVLVYASRRLNRNLLEQFEMDVSWIGNNY